MSGHRSTSSDYRRTAALSINRSCEYLDCSRSHLYAAIRRGEIKTVRLGARIRIRISELDTYLERGSP